MNKINSEDYTIASMFLLFLVCFALILSFMVCGCVWRSTEIKTINATYGLHQVTCYQNSLKCYKVANELCTDGFHVLKTTVKKDVQIWYTTELCGASLERRTMGVYPRHSGCQNDYQYFSRKNTVDYDAFIMLINCNQGDQNGTEN